MMAKKPLLVFRVGNDQSNIGRCLSICLFSLWLVGCATVDDLGFDLPGTAEETLPRLPGRKGDAYLGLVIRDNPEHGTLVSWVRSGPFDGIKQLPLLSRGDIIESVNGTKMNRDEIYALVKEMKPGDEITLSVLRTNGNRKSAVATPGPDRIPQTLRVAAADRRDWTGPIRAPRPEGRPTAADVMTMDEPSGLEAYLTPLLETNELTEPVDKLKSLFAETLSRNVGYNSLSRVGHPFHAPTRLPELTKMITTPLRAVQNRPGAALIEAGHNLDEKPPTLKPSIDLSQPAMALVTLAEHMTNAQSAVNDAFAAIPPNVKKEIPDSVGGLMTGFHLGRTDHLTLIRGMRASTSVNYKRLLDAAGELSGVLHKSKVTEDHLWTRLPSRLKKYVEGNVIAVRQHEGKWYVYGGTENNRYDLSMIDVVIDAGGDDEYVYSKRQRPAVQVVVDMAGNDVYKDEHLGPASAVLGVNILVDYEGNDHYSGAHQSCGSALMGVGLLLDHAGNDKYEGESWSLGSGFYGAGMLIDLNGRDSYLAHHASEGIGGPRGFGLLYDGGSGNDLYRANGPTPSVYGDPAVFYGLSQGVGFGFRGYDSGGIGVLMDGGGHDRYEAGEFSQGGGYYWGLGILDDRNGNDLYYGHRYGQGFGCHQATGALIDHNGNDTYWGMTAADQGAAWDIGMGMLLDIKGNDSYRSDGLSQGAAAMQGIGWQIDLEGRDAYLAPSRRTNGMSSGNRYHYDRTKCMSWSLFMDIGGSTDHYAWEDNKDELRGNGKTVTTGAPDEKNPGNSPLHGLFIDTPEPVTIPGLAK